MTAAIHALSERDLQELSAALRSGVLTPEYTPNTLERVLGREKSLLVADDLQELAIKGLGTEQTAEALDLLRSDRQRRPSVDDAVSLVMTGPALEFASRDTGAVVRDLFASATTSVLVAGYAVHQGRRVFESLANRMHERPELHVRLFLAIQRGQGDTTTSSDLILRFSHRFRSSQWPRDRPLPHVYFDPRSLEIGPTRTSLHAKCIVVDSRRVFVSSANFTEAAQQRNIEVGVTIDSEFAGQRLTEFFDSMVVEGKLVGLSMGQACNRFTIPPEAKVLEGPF